MTFHEDFETFTDINVLPASNWNEAADFLEIHYINGGAKEAIKHHLTKKPTPPAPPPPVKGESLEDILIQRLNGKIGQQIDEEKIIELINLHSNPNTQKTEIFVNNELKATLPGRQHKEFTRVMKMIKKGLNIWLHGEAGTGKTQLAENAAIALNRPFYSCSVCAQTQESKFFGYSDANGKYVSTLFRKAYEEGGVFLIDEIDNGSPNTLNALNAALANGICAFADGMVKRHPDFQCIATANTFGHGGNRQYVGRLQPDAALLNRFTQYYIGYDEQLELEMWGNMAKRCQSIRQVLKGELVIISMRNISNAYKLATDGDDFTEDEALELAVLNTLPENLRSRAKYC